MSGNSVRKDLQELRDALLEAHKALLRFQREVLESLEGRSFSVYDVLHLSVSHPDFEWLRKFSSLLVLIDEKLEEKDDPTFAQFFQETSREIRQLLEGNRLKTALDRDPTLYLQIAKLKQRARSGEQTH